MFAWPLSPEEGNTAAASLWLLEYILLPAPELGSRLSLKPVSSYVFGVGSLTVAGMRGSKIVSKNEDERKSLNSTALNQDVVVKE